MPNIYKADWKPDPRLPLPIYRQIEQYVQARIRSGEWSIGMRLPPQRTLAEAFGVNRSTVVTAMEALMAEGWIEGRGRGGTRVIGIPEEQRARRPMNLPDWNAYVEEGGHYPNLPMIQRINRLEFDPDIIRLGTGELSPALLPQEQIREMFASLAERPVSLGYEHPQGDEELRQLLSRELARQGIQASPSAILIVSGALQALQLISAGLLGRQSAILLEKPSYLYSIHAFQSAGMKLIGLPMDEEGLRLSELERCWRTYRASMLYTIPTFHNPTGAVMSDLRRQQLLTLCETIGLPVLEDGAYQELWLDREPPAPLKSRDEHGIVLHVGTMSKSVSPGLRIGWVAGPEPVIERLADIKMQTDYGSSSLSQQAAKMWFASGMHLPHLNEIRQRLRERRDAMLALLDVYWPDIADWSKPEGGFYVWVSLRSPVPVQRLFNQALKHGILLNPGVLYDRSAVRQLRLSYAYASLPELEHALKLLPQLIRGR
ncbi:PLP-dependent aminotransferase family protein [Paenibacillus thiaminolyticus]|uniref:aminotransferase-like domain-containing protein n=1 Tax=Paenibacillus thiaminolyticus TaxID=49283 RepID=UPI0011640264|nr:PLP-dependent aminotransferase family protein [Paenibacillus thiaminolyticus]WCR28323.1 PLP-dependent aminotransferase family protein [Paenibacillus thiaminolyticus]